MKLAHTALLMILIILTSSPAFTDEAKEQLIPITIAEYGEFLLYTSLYVAYSEKFFEDEGLKVTIVPAGGDEKVFAALLSGDAQFGISDPTFTAISGQRGRPGRIVASILQNVPGWGVTKQKKIKAIKSPGDLEGLTVATYPAPSTSYTLQKRMFQQGNIRPRIREITYGGLLAALDAGVVDIALENEPNVSIAVQNGAHVVYSLTDYYPDFAFTGLSVLPEYLEMNPEIVQKVVNAFQRATNYMMSNHSGTVEILAERFPEISKEVIDISIKNTKAANTFPMNGIVRKSGWDLAIALRKEVGDLRVDAPYDEYVVTSYAEKAMSIR